MDKFTSSVFGSIQQIELPRQGNRIYQGGKAWKIQGGERELVQVSPLSGKVVEVNKKILENPKHLNRKDPEKNWILKIAPLRLARGARNLLTGSS
jgi:glycine cleavage system H protein